jgi:hypothetical protein
MPPPYPVAGIPLAGDLLQRDLPAAICTQTFHHSTTGEKPCTLTKQINYYFSSKNEFFFKV